MLPISAGKRVCRRGVWEGTLPACGKWSLPSACETSFNVVPPLVPQSLQHPSRTHCPAPPSINNGYYLTDRQSETPLALPAVISLGGEQVNQCNNETRKEQAGLALELAPFLVRIWNGGALSLPRRVHAEASPRSGHVPVSRDGRVVSENSAGLHQAGAVF